MKIDILGHYGPSLTNVGEAKDICASMVFAVNRGEDVVLDFFGVLGMGEEFRGQLIQCAVAALGIGAVRERIKFAGCKTIAGQLTREIDNVERRGTIPPPPSG